MSDQNQKESRPLTNEEFEAMVKALPLGPYRPTTEEVRHDWATFQNTTGDGHLVQDAADSYPAFDAWLKSVVTAAKAEGLREEAARWENTTDGRPYNAYGVAREIEFQSYVIESEA